MRPEAANKLLKIIEEPYDDTIFILVSNDDSKVLPTIFPGPNGFISSLSPPTTYPDILPKIAVFPAP